MTDIPVEDATPEPAPTEFSSSQNDEETPTPRYQATTPEQSFGTSPEVADAEHNHYRKYFLYVLIGGVVVSALISIGAILIGRIDDNIARALWTTFLTVIHALVILAFMSSASRKRSAGDELTVNALYTVTIASYFTSVLAAWDVLGDRLTGDFYQLYFYTVIIVLVVRLLLRIRAVDEMTKRMRQALLGSVALLWAYLIPSVFDDEYIKVLPGLYYRGIAALAVLIGTLAVLMTIFHRIYTMRHPEARVTAESHPKRFPVWAVVLIILVGLWVAAAIFSAVVRLFFSNTYM